MKNQIIILLRRLKKLLRKDGRLVALRPQCKAARNKALRWVDKEYEQQFARLRDYAAEIVGTEIRTVDFRLN